MKKYRKEKSTELMKKVLSHFISREMKEPRIKCVISITDIKLVEDLKQAKIYVSIYGLNKKEKVKALEGLSSSCNFLKFKLSENIRLKYMPELLFVLDDSIERGFHLIEKLDKIKEKELVKNDT